MELTINARKIELTPQLRSYMERKLGRFNHKLENIMETKIEVFEEPTRSAQDRTVVRVNISGANIILHSEERAENILTAVDRVSAAITKQIEHRKGKQQNKSKGGPTIRIEPVTIPGQVQRQGKVVEVKRFGLKPMSLGEALEQIELLGYDFLLFLNTDTKTVNMLQRRPDGNYNLIQSEPG